MSFGGPARELRRRAAVFLAIGFATLAATTGAASADTTFGGNPDQEQLPEVTTELSCAPLTCTLLWNGAVASDQAPIGPGGGSGTVTSVTLPAMPDPGPMQAVVLTSTVQVTRDPAHPDTVCCTVKELSPTFTVPPNQVTTVPLSLRVSASAAADPSKPGDTSVSDGVGISMIEAESSAPLRSTENPADNTRIWAPALTAPSSTTTAPLIERPGYELDARFTFAADPGGGKPASPEGPGSPEAGGGPGAKSGLTLHRGVLRPGKDGRTLTLGTAANPPTASTRQTLTIPAPKSLAGSKSKKPLAIGHGKTVVPDGKKATMKLVLNRRGRAALAEGPTLVATLTVVARNPAGESQTVTRRVRVKPAAKKAG